MKNEENKAIILDLDDTIFKTRSMDSRVFEPFFADLRRRLNIHYTPQEVELIIDDLWHHTWNIVMDRYHIPFEILSSSFEVLESLNPVLDIAPYPDYECIKRLPCPKFLVTTSLTSLQTTKIKALNIRDDFTKIVINDPFRHRKTKQDIFAVLASEFALVPGRTYVVGDNPESEIKAGNGLNMVTVQILREGVVKGNAARHHIHSFYELEAIMNLKSNHLTH
jgi:FMN phosphatase YigB (HAD superfamily)